MTVTYRCTRVEKTHELDDYEGGMSGELTSLFEEDVDIVATTLTHLVRQLGQRYDLTMTDLYPHDDLGESSEEIRMIHFARLEDADGNPPTSKARELWQKKKLELYNAEYTFFLAKHVPLLESDFADAGVKLDG